MKNEPVRYRTLITALKRATPAKAPRHRESAAESAERGLCPRLRGSSAGGSMIRNRSTEARANVICASALWATRQERATINITRYERQPAARSRRYTVTSMCLHLRPEQRKRTQRCLRQCAPQMRHKRNDSAKHVV